MTPIEYPCTIETVGYIRHARRELRWSAIQIAMAFQVNQGTVSDILRGLGSRDQPPIPIPADILAQISIRVRPGYPCAPEMIGFIKAAHAEFPDWSGFKLAMGFLVNPGTVSRIITGTRHAECPVRAYPPEILTTILARVQPIRYGADHGGR